MAKVIGKEQLCNINSRYFKALQSIEKKSLLDRYDSLENIIIEYIDPKYQHFLAQPVKNIDEIIWHGKPYNETPKIFADLHGEEQKTYAKIKDETLIHYKSVINSLEKSGKKTESEFLKKAIKFVDDRFLFCYDNRVVLGVWGMRLKEQVRESIGEVRKNLFVRKAQSRIPKSDNDSTELPIYSVRFNSGENGSITGNELINKPEGDFLETSDIPQITPNENYEFVGWSENPYNYKITENKEFIALYKPKTIEATMPPIAQPLIDSKEKHTRKGCLKWLFWLLLLLLILLLLWWLFRSCNHSHIPKPLPYPVEDKPWIDDDPNVRNDGGIYNPGNPYHPVPTPPEYKDVLPPQQGILPPIGDKPEVIPGNPSIIANRLNILMENKDKSIIDLAKSFKEVYPNEKYKVVYYDDVVKRMQVEIPSSDRERLKQEIPEKFSPRYQLFVFDEALFEANYTPDDPIFNDREKTWYLKAINALEAWDISRGSSDITIAIVDNGFDLRHPELKSKVVMPYNVWLHSDNVFPQKVDHGTHVAGTALAIADNKQGISGIAPLCAFMPIQVADAKGFMTTTSVLDGVLYALYQGADVVNISLGSQFKMLSQYPINVQKDLIQNHFKEEERLWQEIMSIAASHNATVVIAAGNDNVLAGIDAIQRPDLFITVAAVDKNSQNYSKTDFSNFGSYSTISAPGVDIYSTVGKNHYQTMEGTSMAAPIVSGAVALMKSLNRSLTNKQIICILQSTGIPVAGDIGNMIQLNKALQTVQLGEFVDCTPTPSTGDLQILLSWDNYNDLDLFCTDPHGETIWYKNKRSASGGKLEIDMNVEYPDSKTPLENIYWERGNAPSGKYHIALLYYKQHEHNINNTSYNIKINYKNESKEIKGTITKEEKLIDIATFSIENNKISYMQNTDNSSRANRPINNRKSQLLNKKKQLEQELEEINNELNKLENH